VRREPGCDAKPFALGTRVIQQDRNFPQDSLRSALYAGPYSEDKPKQA
jgi:hypothetical protein